MKFQQEHLPKDKPATERQEYGFSIMDFLEDRWMYILAIIVLLALFYYARASWAKRNRK